MVSTQLLEKALDLGARLAETGLFARQQVQGHGSGVMRLQQFFLVILHCLQADFELLALASLIVLSAREDMLQPSLNRRAQLRCEVNVAIELDDLVLNRLD